MNTLQIKRISFWLRCGSVLVFCMALCACARLTVSSQQTQFNAMSHTIRAAKLQPITHWQINGAFSIRPEQQSATIASYRWQQTGPKQFRIKLYSPLNTDGILIVGAGRRHVTLFMANKPPMVAKSAHKLLLASTGWNLPIANLYYWIRGIAAPGKQQAQFDAYGHLVKLQQAGWAVHFDAYQTVTKNIDLPRILTLRQKHLEIKIVVKQWQLNN